MRTYQWCLYDTLEPDGSPLIHHAGRRLAAGGAGKSHLVILCRQPAFTRKHPWPRQQAHLLAAPGS